MTMKEDIRWVQRFSNYRRALRRLAQAVNIVLREGNGDEDTDDLLREGLIQRFEYTHELAWKVMKDYAEYQGYTEVGGSRDASRLAFQMSLITDIDGWLEMIRYRNLTSHTYSEETADEAIRLITERFYPLFLAFYEKGLQLIHKDALPFS